MYANLKNKLKVLNKSYTFYNTDPKGISSKYKKFSKLWWKKRNEAFDYLQYLYRKLGKNFIKVLIILSQNLLCYLSVDSLFFSLIINP